MNKTIERLELTKSVCSNSNDIEFYGTIIKALELLPEMVRILENEHRYHDIECPKNCSKCDMDKLIHKAKELIQGE